MKSLNHLQSWFKDQLQSIYLPQDFEEQGFPLRETQNFSKRQRMQIYRNAYWERLIDALGEDFPRLRKMLGRSLFRQVAQAYFLAFPSSSPTLTDVGHQFEGFLRDHFELKKKPWCLDLARFEWLKVRSFYAPSVPLIRVDDLLNLGEKLFQKRFERVPSCFIFESRFKESLFLGVEVPKISESDFDSNEQTALLIYRKSQGWVGIKKISENHLQLMQDLDFGNPLGQALEMSGLQDPDQVQDLFKTLALCLTFQEEN